MADMEAFGPEARPHLWLRAEVLSGLSNISKTIGRLGESVSDAVKKKKLQMVEDMKSGIEKADPAMLGKIQNALGVTSPGEIGPLLESDNEAFKLVRKILQL
jgi:hypothetical protein